MSEVAISVENLGKRYRIGSSRHASGAYGYKSVGESIGRAISSAVRVTQWHGKSKIDNGSRQENIWALKDVAFEVRRGEIVGIIGRNGAGKSTLLKILSRITEPTTGRVRVCGRLGSLLEVGTGFHPELTGGENVYLNGALLGMKRKEIQRKFDEIVAFAEIERFLNTPVKHYSSGMYVRLAFAIAAHLDQENLLVDEVLAVGDIEFRKKCLDKMRELVSKHGRTVLFVSHDVAVLESFMERGIVLTEGQVTFIGTAARAIQASIASTVVSERDAEVIFASKGIHTAIHAARLLDQSDSPTAYYIPGEKFDIEIVLETDGTSGLSLEVFLLDESRFRIAMASTYQFHQQMLPNRRGEYMCRLKLDPLWLASGHYYVEVRTSEANVRWDHSVEEVFRFEVPFSNPSGRGTDFKQSYRLGALAWLQSGAATFTNRLLKKS